MPKLVIDGREIEVPAGTKVIEAAERLGIMVPRFCYHEAMGSVGACRMCAVKFLQGPFKGVQMSCMVDALDGMVVSTTDPEAVAFRKFIIECLMLNHPHDCPVCDEGGQCLLQDETVSGGHGLRRYSGRKRTYRDQYLGPFISHEMNRCIHCYRCSRFYQEFSGYRDLGPMQIGDRVFFGRFSDGKLENPFAGNLVDICPTGVYTDKPARFKARYWDLERAPSLCIHCSLGCNTTANARYREVVRVEARANAAVNGHFICDRGRFGFPFANHPERPRKARVGAEDVSLEEALGVVVERLKEVTGSAGQGAVGAIGSSRSSLEAQSMLARLCREEGWTPPTYFVDPAVGRKVKAAVSRLDRRLGISLREIESADFIIALGVDPINEAPMLGFAMRQASRNEAVIVVIDPRPVLLPFPFVHFPVPKDSMEECLTSFVTRYLSREGGIGSEEAAVRPRQQASTTVFPDSGLIEKFTGLATRLHASKNPVIICGMDIVRETTPDLVANVALSLTSVMGKAGLFYVLPGANGFGAGIFTSSHGPSFVDTLEAIEKGTVKVLVAVESDPLREFPDRARLDQALAKLDLLLVLDYLPSETAKRADIFLPTLSPFEVGSSFVNQEGRLQFATPVYRGGISILQLSQGRHPRRIFGSDIPGGDAKAAWAVLADLSGALTSLEQVAGLSPWCFEPGEDPILAKLAEASYPADGVSLIPEKFETVPSAPSNDGENRTRSQLDYPSVGDLLELLLVDWTFGTEELSTYSEFIGQAEEDPFVCMHPEDAKRANLSAGEKVVITLDRGELAVKLQLSEKMASGTLVLPRHHRLNWQKLAGFSANLPLDRIVKV